uniref:Decapping nuclease n=1 Tax=Panagrolaimus sp. PS1159 TaxID=55785 RepID=A0AC35FQ99_9BILA
PQKSNGCAAVEFQTQLIDRFFVGFEHPIDYSSAFRKVLKEEYDVEEEIGVRIDLTSGCCLLDYLIEQSQISHKDLKELVSGASIVCRRGILNKLLNCPWKYSSEFRFAVKQFHGIYFIKEISTETYQKQYVARFIDPHGLLPKFKNHVIRDFGNASYIPPKEVSTWEQMQGLYLCDLSLLSEAKYLKIFYGTELDAFDNEDNVVEIKLQKGELNPSNSGYYFSEKIRKWYFQNELIGSDTVVVGFHQDKVVTSIKKIKNNTLPYMISPENRWDDSTSFYAAANILSTVLEVYEQNVGRDETLLVELLPKTTDILYHVCDDNIHHILSDAFKDAFEDNEAEVYHDPDMIMKTGYLIEGKKNGWLDAALEKSLKI